MPATPPSFPPVPPVPPRPEATMFPPAELDRRFSAFALDRALSWGIAAVAGYAVWRLAAPDRFWVAVATFAGVALLLGLVTAILLGTTGLTPGKAAVGLRVVRRTDGRPVGFLPALGRTLALGLGGLPTLGLGVATLAWTAAMDPQRRRRGLHDRIGDAVV
ncbi:RDD family protein, partial [Nocardioides sp.]